MIPTLKSLVRSAFLASTVVVFLMASHAFAAAEADLLVAYDQTYPPTVGGSDNAQVLAANAVAGSNLINERCGTGARVRIVGYHQAAQYSYQASSKGGYVGWMANYDSRLADVVDAGNARGADLVAFLCVSTSDGAAAVAQQPGRYSAFDPGQFWSTVVAHELGGHNYGCDHKGGRENPKTVMLHNYCGGGAQGWYSNPNIWLNGTRLLGEGSCLGAAVSGGDNSLLISNNAQGVADRSTRVVTAPNLGNVVQRWAFNQAAGNAPAGTTVTDAVAGTALATVQGNGAIFTGSGLRLPGGASGSGAAYLQLPSGVISKNTNATIEIWATPLSAPNWSRIADFNNGTSNYLTLTSATGTDITAQRFESNVGGTAVTLDSNLPTTAGVPHLYTITYASTGTATGRWTWYRDGDQVAFLDVAYALSALSDVNNWLGRSAFSADAFANCEYAEVRISNVAMSRDEILANYELGPNRTSANANLTMDDALGSTSFNSAGHWSDGLAPVAGNSYETYNFRLRTPADNVSRTFAGKSLKLSGGCFTWKGTSSNTITVNDLTLNGDCEVLHAGSGTWTLAGNLKVDSDSSMMRAANGPINLTANLTGASSLLCVNNTVTLGGSNAAFAGKIAVGDGRSSSIAIDSEARLGPNPPALVTDQLTFNRGAITTSGTLVLDDPNRGILFDVNGGTFNVTSGTTTLSCPLYSPDYGTSVVAGGIAKGGLGTLILSSPSSTFKGTLYVDTGSTTSDDGIVRVVNNQVLANAHNPIYINNNTTASSLLQIDGSSGSITLTRVSLAGRNGVTPAVQNLGGTNNVGGLTVMAGGANHIVQSDSGLLNFTGSIYSGSTGAQDITFKGNGDIATLSTISELAADLVNVVKIGSGILTLGGECSHDGTTTLSGGTLRLNGSMTTTTGATTTAVGTTFAGTGTTSSPTRIGGIHAPGNSTNSTGTQTFTGALTYSAAAKLNWSLVANGTAANSSNKVAAQTVTVDSGAAVNLVFNGAGSSVNFTNVYWTQPRSWSVLTATAMGGQFALGSVSTDSAGNSVSSYGSFSLQQTATDVKVNFFPLNATPPSIPTGLSSAGSPSMAALAWVAPIGATSYNVKRSLNSGGPYETIAAGVIATTFADTSVTNGTTYYYVITALNPFGESGESAEILATPHLPATINKANNTTFLNLASSWTGGILPNAWDTAVWSGLAGANSVVLGSNISLKGVVVATNGGAVSIGAGNTLTVGMGGIDLSAATQNLTLSSGLTIGTGHQVWNVASARRLTLNTGTFTRTAGATLNIQGAGTVASSMTGLSNTNGILGSWATFGTGASTMYATLNAGVIAGLTGTSSAIGWTSANNNTFNYDVSATTTNLGVSRVANTVRYTGAAASQNYGNSNTTTLTLNGLLNVGTGTLTLTQAGGGSLGQVLIGTNNGNELDLIAANAEIAIAIPIMNTGVNAGSVIIAGPNTVTLSGSNTFTGGLSLNSGTLQIGNDSALSSGTLTISGGAIRATGASRTIANNVVLNGDFTLGRNTAFSGAITLNDNVTITSANPDVLAATTSTFSGVISGSRGLTFTQGANPSGTIALNAANTYSGGTTLTVGNLQLGHASGLGANTGALTVNGGTLNLNAFSPTVGTLSGTGGIIVNQANGTSTLTSQSAASATFAGALQNGAAGQVLALRKQGSGTLTLTGSSSYTGATTISGGTLMLNGALTGNSAVAVNSGATLAGSGTISGSVTVASASSLAPGNAVGTGTLTLSGALTLNSGSLLRMNLAAPSASAKIAVGGTLTTPGVTTLNITALAGFGPGVYPIITGAPSINLANFSLGATPAGYAYALGASSGTLSLTVAAPLAPPVGLTATADSSSIALNWSSLAGAVSYNVKRSLSSGSGYETIATGVTATSFTDSGLVADTAYFYVLSAVNLAGESENSIEAAASTFAPIDAWRQQKFGSINNTAAAADADPDLDGLTNVVEYAIGSEPMTASPAAYPQVALIGDRLTIRFTRNTAATDVTLNVVAADTLEGTWTEIARSTNGAAFTDNINGTSTGAVVSENENGSLISVQVGDVNSVSANPKRFLRLQVRH